MSVKKQCPKCKKGHLDERTKRSLWVKIPLFWLPIKRYKCGVCGKKSYIFGSNKLPGHTIKAV